MNNGLNQNSRSGYRSKRRKTNLVLNSLIIIVLALIIFVAYNIFASGNDETASTTKETPKSEQTQAVHKEKKDNSSADEEQDSQEVSTDENQPSQESENPEEKQDEKGNPDQAEESQKVVSDGGSSVNVLRTIENPAWKPVGTSQTGEHVPVYDSSSVDWQEMLNAITYATGLDQSNMTVWFLGSDRSTTNASIGTVSSKDKQQKYKVYIKWVDGQGWMPTKVEELASIKR
ncbi:YrrS family protein [Neobacillus mesonae]|uniref:YrrS family protein n=1 Tax=Neobacillus mesonae TaxID=1193713 RepID=UPI00203AD143|nr:YrrS family protein [Neobacillus mesonae]MCM3566504.1 YrrS family protein [Neobacillus mesonae]